MTGRISSIDDAARLIREWARTATLGSRLDIDRISVGANILSVSLDFGRVHARLEGGMFAASSEQTESVWASARPTANGLVDMLEVMLARLGITLPGGDASVMYVAVRRSDAPR